MIDSETLNLDDTLLRLQLVANNHNIFVLEWPKDDVFFTICTIQEHGINILTDPIETVLDLKKKTS